MRTPLHIPEMTPRIRAILSLMWLKSLYRRTRRFFRGLLIWGGFSVILFFSVVILALQFRAVRDAIREYALSVINEQLLARVEFSDFNGNVIGGISLMDVRIITGADTLFVAPTVVLRYDIQALLTRTAVVNRLFIEQPVIHLLRNRDSSWNFERVLKPPADTTTKRPLRWAFSMRDLNVHRATLIVYDSTSSLPYPSTAANVAERFTPESFRLDSLMLSLAATLRFAEQRHAVTINHLSCVHHSTNVALKKFAVNAAVDDNRVELFNARLYTANTSVRANFVLDSINVFQELNLKTLQKKPLLVSIHADSISSAELRRASPIFDNIGGTPSLKLELKGTVNNLVIERLTFAEKLLALEGRVQNITTPKAMSVRLKFDPMSVSDDAIRRYFPTLHFPDLRRLGAIHLTGGVLEGDVRSVRAQIAANSAVGDCSAEVIATNILDSLAYSATVTTQTFNLALITGNAALESSLNTTLTCKGKGTSLENLVASLRLDATASHIAGRSFDAASLEAKIHDAGYITVQSFKVLWARRYNNDFDYQDGATSAPLVASSVLGSGWINLQQAKQPQYKIDVRTNHLDVAKIFPALGVHSDATMQIYLTGRSFDPDSITANLHINAQEFYSGGRDYGPFTFNVRMEQQTSLIHSMVITSPEIADVTIKGRFSFGSFIGAFASQVDNWVYEVRRKYHLMRDSAHIPVTEAMYITAPSPDDIVPLDVQYRVAARDLSLISLFTGSSRVFAVGTLQGSIQGTNRDYLFSVAPSYFDSFRYTDGEVTVDLFKTRLEGEFYNQTFGDSLNTVSGSAKIQCDSAFRYDDLGDEWLFPHSTLEARYNNSTLTFDIQSEYRDYLRFFTKGEFVMQSPVGKITLDTGAIRYQKTFLWTTTSKVLGSLNADGLTFHRFFAQRPKAEKVSLSGLFWLRHFRDAQIVVHNMPLESWNPLLMSADRIELLEPLRGNMRELTCTINGTTINPLLKVQFDADTVYYNGLYVGAITMNAQHKDSVVSGFLNSQHLLRGDSTQLFSVRSFAFPLNLAFTTVERRITDRQPIDVHFDVNNFPLGALSLFIPGVNTVRGLVQSKLSITGETHDNMVFRGDVRLNKVSFITDATNMRYFGDGIIKLLNSNVTIETFNIYNDSLDYPRGRGFASGTATLKGFSIALFDITAQIPQLMVLSNASRITHPGLYGDVVIQTGVKPLHFRGTLEEPFLRGDINVLSANVYFPDSKTIKRTFKPFCFESMIVQGGKRRFVQRDCAEQEYQSLPTAADLSKKNHNLPDQMPSGTTRGGYVEQLLDSIDGTLVYQPRQPETNTLSTQQPISAETTAPKPVARRFEIQRGFSDKIDFDLNVFIRGNFFMTMDFGPADQLVANIAQDNPSQPLRYIQTPDNPDEPRLFGDVRVKDGSKYNFYRIFNATGTMAFNTGNISNPQVNLTATLRGQRFTPNGSANEEYQVILNITGTKQVPVVKINYFIGNTPGVGDAAKIQYDAIMLMVFGKRSDELQQNLGASSLLGNSVSSVVTSQSSSVASKLLTDLLQGTGFIRSADVYFAGGGQNTSGLLDIAQARVQLTAEITRGVFLQLGNEIRQGNALNPSFTIDIPLSTFTNLPILKDVLFQVTRVANTSSFITQQRELEFKFTISNKW